MEKVSKEPMFDALDDGMARHSTRQDPMLGVPDFAARDVGTYEDNQQTNVSVKGLDDVITATRAAMPTPKKIVEKLKAKSKS